MKNLLPHIFFFFVYITHRYLAMLPIKFLNYSIFSFLSLMHTVNVSYFICIIITITYHDHTENIIINRFISYNRNLIIFAVNKFQFYTNCLVTSPSHVGLLVVDRRRPL